MAASTRSKTSEPEQQAEGHAQEQARMPAITGPHAGILGLQRAAGNRAVDGLLQPSAASVPPIVNEVVRGGGQPLDTATRGEMEHRFGKDFSGVRVHTDAQAARSARSIGAQAYTSGSHIVFGSGQHPSASITGKRILAHELSHVVQMTNAHPMLQLATNHNVWEREAERAAHSNNHESPHQLSTGAPGLIRMRVDPQLQGYVAKIYAISRESGIGSEKTELVVARLLEAVNGLDLQDQDNFTFISEVVLNAFPSYILEGFLLQVDRITPLQQKPSPERERFNRQEEMMAVGRNKFTGGYGPGILLPFMTATAAGAVGEATDAVSAMAQKMPGFEKILMAFGSGAAFFTGVSGGLIESISKKQMEQLGEQLNKAAVFTVAFPPVFLEGATFGIIEDAINVLKSVFGLVTGELGEFLAVALEFIQLMTSSEGEVIAFQLGLEVGRGYAKEIIEAGNENLVKFTFNLGRIVGPTIIYTILGLLAPELVVGLVAPRILKVLGPLLKNEPRVMRLLQWTAKRMGHRPHGPDMPNAIKKVEQSVVGETLKEAAEEKIALGGGAKAEQAVGEKAVEKAAKHPVAPPPETSAPVGGTSTQVEEVITPAETAVTSKDAKIVEAEILPPPKTVEPGESSAKPKAEVSEVIPAVKPVEPTEQLKPIKTVNSAEPSPATVPAAKAVDPDAEAKAKAAARAVDRDAEAKAKAAAKAKAEAEAEAAAKAEADAAARESEAAAKAKAEPPEVKLDVKSVEPTTEGVTAKATPEPSANEAATAKATPEPSAKATPEPSAKTTALTAEEMPATAAHAPSAQEIQELVQRRAANEKQITELNKSIRKAEEQARELDRQAANILERRETGSFRTKADAIKKKAKESRKEVYSFDEQRNDLQSKNKIISDKINPPKIGPGPGEPHGGAYKNIPTAGGEVNHIPADSVSPLNRDKGPCIWMEKADHMKTNSWGKSDKAVEWRVKQKELIDQGRFKEAVQMDIDDIRKKFGVKYDKGIQEMLDYTNTLHPTDLKTK